MKNLVTLSLITFLAFGCKTDSTNLPTKELAAVDLIGEWEIYDATRNGKKTKSLEKGTFVFQADNTVNSNLFANENSHKFTIDKKRISIEGDPIIKFLQINSLVNDTLIVDSKMKAFRMEFFMKKK